MFDKHRLVPHIKEQLTEAVKVLTHEQRSFQATRKERITDLNKLQPGDHVSFYKTDFYYAHHGIVCEAHTDYLRVIHYFNTLENAWMSLMKGSIYVAEIIESEWPVENLKSTSEEMYLNHYDGIPCFSNEETLQRAFSQLGRRGYSLSENNCEHWARWCRTGQPFSEQIYKFRELVKKKSATLLIVDPTALLIKDIALVGGQTFGHFLGAVGSGVVLTAVEGVSTFIDIKQKKNERKKGSLSDVALKKYIVRRIASASGTVIGGIVGTIVGTILIPAPVLGATVGGFVGSVSGKVLGGVSGIALSKILEVYGKHEELQIHETLTISKLMNNLSLEREIIRGLVTRTMDSEEEKNIVTAIQETMNPNYLALHSLLEKIVRNNLNTTPEECHAATKLTTELFTDPDSCDYFVLTPVPDDNAHEEFASSMDLLVIRWPIEAMKPWETSEEQVLNIDDLNLNREKNF